MTSTSDMIDRTIEFYDSVDTSQFIPLGMAMAGNVENFVELVNSKEFTPECFAFLQMLSAIGLRATNLVKGDK